jgi:hypothetical protein
VLGVTEKVEKMVTYVKLASNVVRTVAGRTPSAGKGVSRER